MVTEDGQYPIAEFFISPQGEGQYCGAQMAFVRLAGCTVGKPFPKEMYKTLPIYTEMCTLYDGRTFACDTNYRSKEKISTANIFGRIPKDIKHICITGGEPFMHNLNPFVAWAIDRQMEVHIETSGTLPLVKAFPSRDTFPGIAIPSKYEQDVWITVSPKFGVLPEMIRRADEIKILIDKDFDPHKLPVSIIEHNRVYIQPVNFEHEINPENLKLVMKWQKEYPNWRVSLQLHKVLSHYLGERVL